ncbi:MAG: HAD-IA family hydrolase [Rhodocyclaceae bacterium]|nr:HAD-IA family hydrolase [Rhodocyclaceae bacterium]
MARRYDLIVFDWDGTLLDSAAAIVHAIQAASRDLGLPAPDDRRARHVIGLGLEEALRYAVPALAPADYPKMVERYRYHYLTRDHELELFAGAGALVERLAREGWLLGVATGKSRHGLARAMAHSGLGAYFDATRCADECFSKPHPAMLLELMTVLATDPARTLMIGDTSHDLEMARNAGVDAVAISHGAHDLASLSALPQRACVDSIAALDRWLAHHA